jgi:hypothetical protein
MIPPLYFELGKYPGITKTKNQFIMTTYSVVRVLAFNKEGKAFDKNGKQNVYLEHVAGEKVPENARVISGTIAISRGLAIGATMTIKIEKTGKNDAGYEVYQHSVIDANAGAAVTNNLLGSMFNTPVVNAESTPANARVTG